jgi:hypothetical protein
MAYRRRRHNLPELIRSRSMRSERSKRYRNLPKAIHLYLRADCKINSRMVRVHSIEPRVAPTPARRPAFGSLDSTVEYFLRPQDYRIKAEFPVVKRFTYVAQL